MAKQNKYDRRHQQDLFDIQALIDEIYAEAAKEAARIGAALPDFNPDRLFSFSDYPATRRKVSALLQGLKSRLTGAIVNGVRSAWTLANNKNDELCRQVFGDNVGRLSSAQYRRYFNNNEDACEAFLKRRVSGLNLSDRVRNYTNQFKREIELGLDCGLRSGRSADEMSRDLRQFLKYPDKLFRRVRTGVDSDGNPIYRLSKAASEFHPGRGVYRSSYKNARRLAATETNIAYRTSDYERWQQMDFIVGQLIEPSKTNHPVADICDDLKGRYPKDFKFTGWHPHCRCHALSILKSMDEIAEDNRRILRGEEPTEGSVNTVTEPPKGFEKWIADNEDRVLYGQSVPYFIRDNPTYAIGGFSISHQPEAWDKITSSANNAQSAVGAVVKPDFEPFKMTQEKLDELKANGSLADKYTLEMWEESSLNGINPDRLRAAIEQKASEIGMSVDRIRFVPKSGQRSRISAEGDGFDLTRYFTRNADGSFTVEHDYFEVNKAFQGKGFSKTVLRSFYQEYRAIGVTEIRVHANIDVGGYTWARYGFQAENYNDAFNAVRWDVLSSEQKTHVTRLIDDWYSTRAKTETFPMKKIADLTYGRKALLGRDWYGVLNLKDETQRQIFESYLGI